MILSITYRKINYLTHIHLSLTPSLSVNYVKSYKKLNVKHRFSYMLYAYLYSINPDLPRAILIENLLATASLLI